MKVRAVGYARVSSSGQRERDTIASQLRLIPEYIARQGWALAMPIETYVDDGLSAKAGKLELRRGLAALLRDAALGLFDVVVVVDIDRLTRAEDLAERGAILGALQAAKVRIASAMSGEVLDLSTSMGDLFATLKAYFAAEDNRKRSERIIQGRITSLRRGRKGSGQTPYGLRFDRAIEGADAWSVDPERARLIVEMYERVAAGESCHAIGRDFEARGVPRKASGTPWTRNRIWEIVRARYPVGEWLADVQRRIVVAVPPIVTEDLWQRAQVAMRQHKTRGLRKTKHAYLLEGLAVCGACGAPIRIRSANHSRRASYVCGNRLEHWRGGAPCRAPTVHCDELDDRVWRGIGAELEDPGFPALLAARRAERRADARDWSADADGHRRHLARLDRVEASILARFRRGAIGEAALDTELAALHRERAAVRTQLQAAELAQEQIGAARARIDTADQVVARLRAAIAGATPELRRAAFMALVVPQTVVLRDRQLECTLEIPIASSTSVPGQAESTEHESHLRLRIVA
jgi:DNA invertase Pin-like site-specific DNA recombinase